MRIEVSEKEFKKESLDFNSLEIVFMLAIKTKHPQMWKDFKKFIEFIENYKGEK